MKPFYESKDCAVQSYESIDLEFPEHLHDHVEILLVLEGGIAVGIAEESRELQAGDCAVIFPQQIHNYHTPVKSRTRLYIFDNALTGRYLQSVRKCRPACPFVSAREMPEDGMLALDRLYRLSCVGQGAQEAECSNVDDLCAAWIQVLFALLWFRLAPEKRKQSEGMELTCQVVQYVMEHFQEPLTLEMLAEELHVNKYSVSHIFSDRLHINFRRYLNHIRLEYAMQLMKTSNAPLVDIWAEAGFNSQRSFNRAFAEIMGMAPMEYRKSVTDYGLTIHRTEGVK